MHAQRGAVSSYQVDVAREPVRSARLLVFVLAGTAVLGIVFAWMIPLGLPYDEPSHWQNVVFYVTNLRMPVLGDPGVSYEAQMGPVAYVLDALVAAPLHLFSWRTALYGVRLLGVAEHVMLTWLIWRLVARVLPRYRWAPVLAAVAVGLNPMLVTMAASVQNDTLALVLAVVAIDVATNGRWVSTRRSVAVVGGLVGLAMLTKITMWPVAIVLGIALLVRRRFLPAALYVGAVAAVFGWWVVRNLVLYGDLTGQAGVESLGYKFPPLDGVHPVALVRSVMTYLWLPTEYVRNAVVSPTIVDVLVVVLSIAGAAGLVLLTITRSRARPDVVKVLVAIGVLAVAGWLVIATSIQAVAFRFAYACLPIWFTGASAWSTRGAGAKIALALAALLLAISGWFLAAVHSLPPLPFEIGH